MDYKKYAICGFDCSSCPLYKASINNDIDEIKRNLMIGPNIDVTVESHGCKGCRTNTNCQCAKMCYMRECAHKKEIESCAFCKEYPCDYVSSFISEESKKVLDELHEEFKNR